MLSRVFLWVCVALTPAVPAAANCACGECLGHPTDGLQRALEVATLNQRLYRHLDHPARVRELRSEIEFAEARLESLRTLRREYEPFTRWRVGNPLAVSAEQNRLAILREERHLRTLRQVYAEEHRLHGYRLRLHAQAVAHASQRLAHANPPAGDGSIEIINH